MPVLYKLNPEDPMDPQVAIIGGAGTVSLKLLEKRIQGRIQDLYTSSQSAHDEQDWEIIQYRTKIHLLNDLDTVVEAYKELEQLRQKGGPQSRGIKK